MRHFKINDHSTSAVYAIDIKSRTVIADESSEKSLIPASCMKVITTAVSLELLGAAFRFETHLEFDGTIDKEGTLHGNLYIKGYGDPCLGSKRFGGFARQLEIWSEAIKKLGIKKIEGKIWGDASHWEKAQAAASWQWEDLGNYYGAGGSALSFHDNEYTLFFEKESLGHTAAIKRTEPEICHSLQNEVTIGPSGSISTIFGSEFSHTHYVRGKIAEDSDFTIRGSFPDPALQTAFMLTKALDIKVVGKHFEPKERKVFHKTQSPSLEEIITLVHHQSVNLYAEHLLKQIGGGKMEEGIEAVKRFLQRMEVPLGGFHMADGCGLSRKNLVTAKMMVALLTRMKGNKVFESSLASEICGTKAKSGSMTGIKGYVGYKGNKVFAILVNHFLNYEEKMKQIEEFLTEL